MIRRTGVVGLLALICCGCLKSMDRASMMRQLHNDAPRIDTVDEDIAEILALKPQLKFPCRVAVYLAPNCDWTGKDKEVIQKWGDTLRAEGIVSDMFVMGSMFSPELQKDTVDLKKVRRAAARHGADAVLMLTGTCRTHEHKNFAAVLNLTIVGGYVIPASHRDSMFLTQGVLVDVNNGFLYLTNESEGNASIVRPTFIIEDKNAIETARFKSIDGFGDGLMKHMRILRDSALPVTGRK